MKVAIKGPRLWSKRVAKYAQELYNGCVFQPAWAYRYADIETNYDLLLHYVDGLDWRKQLLHPIVDIFGGRRRFHTLNDNWKNTLLDNNVPQLQEYRNYTLYYGITSCSCCRSHTIKASMYPTNTGVPASKFHVLHTIMSGPKQTVNNAMIKINGQIEEIRSHQREELHSQMFAYFNS